jgi:formylglycine-generating enzyme required for sulfatase activity
MGECLRYIGTEGFAEFLESGGYRQEALWDPEGWQWLKDEGISEPGYWQDRKWNNPISPVIRVSWYEARAYCRWLDGKLKQEGVLCDPEGQRQPFPADYSVQLPSEELWEYAARGNVGREYPWGDEFEEYRANTSGEGIGRNPGTTAVCTYPQGKSPAGVWDMGGNVFEWTDSFGMKNDRRVVRGGSWNYVSGAARCAFRDGHVARAIRYNYLGFRVVLSLASDC